MMNRIAARHALLMKPSRHFSLLVPLQQAMVVPAEVMSLPVTEAADRALQAKYEIFNANCAVELQEMN